MTLTLEQVRQTRFHLARRNGYEPADVDNFVDKVEATLSQLGEENDTLKKQLETLSSTEPESAYEPGAIFVPGSGDESAELAELREQLEAARAELEQVRSDGQGQLDGLRAELDQARSALAGSDQGGVIEQLNGELEGLRGELANRDNELNSVRGELETLRNAPAAEPVAAPTGKVENIVVTAAADAAPAVTRLLQMATEQSERLVGEAQEQATQILSDANAQAEQSVEEASRKAHETLTDARTRAERIESEARVNADHVTNEAQSRSEAVNGEADARRAELFGALETERDELRGKVDHLRTFEATFRERLTAQLQGHIESLSGGSLEPEDRPTILDEPANQSATPRLDALLGDEN